MRGKILWQLSLPIGPAVFAASAEFPSSRAQQRGGSRWNDSVDSAGPIRGTLLRPRNEFGGERRSIVVVCGDDVQIAQDRVLILQAVRIEMPNLVARSIDKVIIQQCFPRQ